MKRLGRWALGILGVAFLLAVCALMALGVMTGVYFTEIGGNW